jgi:hypothetical protein
MKVFTRSGTLKKVVFILLILSAVLMFSACNDDKEGENNAANGEIVFSPAEHFEYEVSDGAVTITKYIGDKAAVNIPADIDGAKVTVIGEGAFYENRVVTSVVIPDSVISIINSAFTYCSNLTSVTIGNGVTSIGSGAFSHCTSLTSITIPNSVTAIRAGAFFGCTNLTSATIPESVTEFGDDVFGECPNLTITSSENSAAHKYAVENNISFKLK